MEEEEEIEKDALLEKIDDTLHIIRPLLRRIGTLLFYVYILVFYNLT